MKIEKTLFALAALIFAFLQALGGSAPHFPNDIPRARAKSMFEPILPAVRDAANRVSLASISDLEEKLAGAISKSPAPAENRKAAEFVFKALRSFGFKPEYQEFEAGRTKTANVLARLAGTENRDMLCVLSCRLISAGKGEGREIDASSAAINLETARILAGNPLPLSVVFVFLGSEEDGLPGSREFVRLARARDWKIAAGIETARFEGAEDSGPSVIIRSANAGLRDLQDAAAVLFSKLTAVKISDANPPGARFMNEAFGNIVSGLGIASGRRASDDADRRGLLAEAAKINVATMMLLASSPQPVRGFRIVRRDKDAIGLVWEPSPEAAVGAYLLEVVMDRVPGPILISVQVPEVTIPAVTLKKGDKIAIGIKACTTQGLQSWDWTRLSLIWE